MAIQMLSENNYDLSLIDLYLPKADGFQVLAHLQRVSSSTSAIVMTGHGSIESAVEAMKKGAVDYLTKPVAFDQLRHPHQESSRRAPAPAGELAFTASA
jgi:DNA-binding NtrC family response regulator